MGSHYCLLGICKFTKLARTPSYFPSFHYHQSAINRSQDQLKGSDKGDQLQQQQQATTREDQIQSTNHPRYKQAKKDSSDAGKDCDWQKTVNETLRGEFHTHRRQQSRKWIWQNATKKAFYYIMERDVIGLLKFAENHFDGQHSIRNRKFDDQLYLMILKFVKSELDAITKGKPNWATDAKFKEERKLVEKCLEHLLMLIQIVPPKEARGEMKVALTQLQKCSAGWVAQLADPKLKLNHQIAFDLPYERAGDGNNFVVDPSDYEFEEAHYDKDDEWK